ncbi:secretin N-terminal domain-containing protein [Frigoriglobus tundricola]|nr:secretin N-terminal domain-containing protein [Frigoriglobus tundricola]
MREARPAFRAVLARAASGAAGLPGGPGAPGLPDGPPGAAGPGGRGAGGSGTNFFSAATFEYKFVDVKSDRKEFEKVITQHGKDGWEFCGSERFAQTDIVLVFKKRKGGGFGGFGGGGFGGGGFGGGFGDFSESTGPGAFGGFGGPGMTGPGVGGPGGRPGMGSGGGNRFEVFPLKHAAVDEVASALQKAFADANLRIVAEKSSNAVVIVSVDPAKLQDVIKMLESLDAKAAKSGTGPDGPKPGAGPGSGAPSAPGMFLNVFHMKNAKAEEMLVVLQKLYPNTEVAADPRTNTVVARADEKTLSEMRVLISKLDNLDSVKQR